MYTKQNSITKKQEVTVKKIRIKTKITTHCKQDMPFL